MQGNPRLRIGLQVEKSRAHGRQLLAGIADFALRRQDWRFDLLEPDDLLDARRVRQYDGLIVRVMDDRTEDALAGAGVPVVDTYGRSDSSPFDTIRLDDAAIADVAAGFFDSHRFSNYAFCGFRGPRFSAARMDAFAARVRGMGRRFFSHSGEGAARLADTFFRNERTEYVPDARPLAKWVRSLPKPAAVFCCNDIRAFQLLGVCEAEGIRVPEEVSVLGVDDDALLCTFTRPPLSSVGTDTFRLGGEAAAMLAERIEGGGAAKPPRIALHAPGKVVERASTDMFPFRTRWLSDAMVYIRRNLGRGITAGDVVRRLGYSHTAVNNAFRAEVGRSVHREIAARRIELARELLSETGMTAAEISAECGFRTPQYFTRAFAAAVGATPDAWRRAQAQSFSRA